MPYFLHVVLGFVMAFLSLIPPGMLNMTAARTTIEKNRNEGIWFSLGAALVVIPQAFIALVFARFFADNPQIVQRLELQVFFVLFLLSMFSLFRQGRNSKEKEEREKEKVFGSVFSCLHMNMLAIPFYLVLSSVLENRGLLNTEQPFINLFVSGVFLGAFRFVFCLCPVCSDH